MSKDLSQLGVGHAYAPGHEPGWLARFDPAQDTGAIALLGLLMLVVVAGALCVLFTPGTVRRGGGVRRDRPARAVAGPGPQAAEADAGALLRSRMRRDRYRTRRPVG